MKLYSVLLSFSTSHVIRRDTSGHISTQSHQVSIKVKENEHLSCDFDLLDLEKYHCEVDNTTSVCTTKCPLGTGVLKQTCQCYKSYGPVLIYE